MNGWEAIQQIRLGATVRSGAHVYRRICGGNIGTCKDGKWLPITIDAPIFIDGLCFEIVYRDPIGDAVESLIGALEVGRDDITQEHENRLRASLQVFAAAIKESK